MPSNANYQIVNARHAFSAAGARFMYVLQVVNASQSFMVSDTAVNIHKDIILCNFWF